jgi:hypothetical protein
MNTNSEIDSYIQMKYYPPECTKTYAESVPEEVRLLFLRAINHTSPIDSSVNEFIKYIRLYRANTWPIESISDHLTRYCWTVLRKCLIEYYEQHGT